MLRVTAPGCADGLGDERRRRWAAHRSSAGCLRPVAKALTFRPGAAMGRLSRRPAPGRGHLEGRDAALRLGRRDRRGAAPGRLGRAACQAPRQQRRISDQRDARARRHPKSSMSCSLWLARVYRMADQAGTSGATCTIGYSASGLRDRKSPLRGCGNLGTSFRAVIDLRRA